MIGPLDNPPFITLQSTHDYVLYEQPFAIYSIIAINILYSIIFTIAIIARQSTRAPFKSFAMQSPSSPRAYTPAQSQQSLKYSYICTEYSIRIQSIARLPITTTLPPRRRKVSTWDELSSRSCCFNDFSGMMDGYLPLR